MSYLTVFGFIFYYPIIYSLCFKGGSDDWAAGAAGKFFYKKLFFKYFKLNYYFLISTGIKYSYTIELRPGQSGTDSFYGLFILIFTFILFNNQLI